jgi:hypothetical protein
MIKYAIPVLASTLIFAACTGTEKSDKNKVEITVDSPEANSSDDHAFILPQPISLANAFKSAGLTYQAGKTNPTTNKDTYSMKMDQLLNLGVYSTDLAYCAINNKSQEAREYLMVIQDLGTKVGLKSVFSDKAIIEKFDKNLGNSAALEELIYDIQDKSDTYLENNDLKYLAAVEFAGAWVEGMYLGIEDSKNKTDIGVAMADQMILLENTIKGLRKHPSKNDKRLKSVILKLDDLMNTYNTLESVKTANKNVNFEAPQLKPAEFETIATKIKALRTSIVSPSTK